MATKKVKKNDGPDAVAKKLDSILEALQSLLIVQGHGAGLTRAQVRALAKVADARVGKVWKQLEAAEE